MNLSRFLQNNKMIWTELEHLLKPFQHNAKTISAKDIDRFTYLYKTTSAHLAYVQTYYPQDEITKYLNQLLLTAHNLLYKEQNKSNHQFAYFFKVHFISLIRRRLPFIGFAFLLFFIGGISGFLAVSHDSLNLYSVLPSSIANNIDPSQVGQHHNATNNPVMATSIMTNNIKVAILAFLGGITFGIWTIYLMLYNGLMLGALAAVFWSAGKSYIFWAFILPHGIIELTVTFIAGGAGLYMGYRMFVPGPYPWKLQLIQSIKESSQLLLGTIPLFMLAGTIEGYVTPSSLPLAAKYFIALLTFLLLITYYLYGTLRGKQSSTI